MQQADIRLLIGVLIKGFERGEIPQPSFPDKKAQDAYKQDSAAIEKASKEAALDLAAASLSAIFRIADGLERIAKALEYEPKQLFEEAPNERVRAT